MKDFENILVALKFFGLSSVERRRLKEP